MSARGEGAKVLVFGGSFDPPHTGHMNLLANGVRAVCPARVLVVPAGAAPHKAPSPTPGDLRAAMCACFSAVFPAAEICRMEIDRPGKSFTSDTLAELRRQNPGCQWYLLIGADMLLSFTEWHHWQELLGLATLVAAGRAPGQHEALAAAARALEAAGGRVIFAEGPVVEASSGAIRAAIAKGDEEAYKLIPPPADEIARARCLYAGALIPCEEAKRLARQQLSDRRFCHTANVAAAAKKLAKRWGANPEKAELAGWLHDIVKERSRDELLQLLAQDDIMSQSSRRPQPVWHGPAAAVYAHSLGVADPEVLSAIACHTTGKAGMSTLDKVLFLADVVSDERSFDGVGNIRALAGEDLDAAVIAAMEENLAYLTHKGKTLDTDTVEALAALKATAERGLA